MQGAAEVQTIIYYRALSELVCHSFCVQNIEELNSKQPLSPILKDTPFIRAVELVLSGHGTHIDEPKTEGGES